MEKRVKIYCNKKVFVATLVLVLTFIAIDVFFFYLATEHFTSQIPTNSYSILAPFSFLVLAAVILALSMGTDARMILTKEGVEFRRWFKKTEFHPYKDYPYVEKAFYMYYGMPMYYIVLSNFRLPEKYRTAINFGPSTNDCIKIRYKKKEYEALMSIVPPRIASTLRAKFNDVPFGKFDFLFL